MTNRILALVALLCSGCVTTSPPAPPRVGPYPNTPVQQFLAIWVTDNAAQPIVGATVTVSPIALGGPAVFPSTNGDGWSGLTVLQGDYRVRVETDRYAVAERDVTVRMHTDARFALTLKVPPVSRLRIERRMFANDQGFWRGRLVGPTSLLRRSVDERGALLDDYARLGFNGVRVFAGALPWANQTAEQARAELPKLLDEAARRGLYVYVSALTESKQYDVESHLRAIIDICQAHVACFLEGANEPYHPTQADLVHDYQRLFDLVHRMTPMDIPWSLGAPETDELDPAGKWPQPVGPFVTIHLDRSRDKWNQIRRLRELAGVSEGLGVPVVSGEPMGAAEASIPRRRESDPAFFFAMGALCRGFELGACAFHSEDGLNALPFEPNQRAGAEAFIAGWKAIDTPERLQFFNATWAGSPVAKANFDSTVVRAFSFVSGARGWLVLVGLSGDPGIQYGGGWRDGGLIAERPGIQVRALAR